MTGVGGAVPGVPPARRRSRRALVVVAGGGEAGERYAHGLADSLGKRGIEALYLGKQPCARDIAATVAQERVDSIELCLGGSGGVPLLTELLRALIDIGRRNVSIVVHRAEPAKRRLG